MEYGNMKPGVAYAISLATLAGVATYAITTSYLAKRKFENTRAFYSAKNCRGPVRLAWSFFSSGMGSWTFSSFPEIGVLAGSWGIIGYILSCCLAVLILAAVGPASRSLLGDGVTLTDYVLNRYGRAMQIYVMVISIFYQFISLASELTCVGSLVNYVSQDAKQVVPIISIVAVTNMYTSIGGFRASLSTDVIQGIGVLSLVLIVVIVMMFQVSVPKNAWKDTNVAALTNVGFESLVTLVIAVVSANLFFTGYWQRVFAAKDDSALRRACVYSCFMIIPFSLALCISGMVTYLAYPDVANDPYPNYFFPSLLNMGVFWHVLVLMVITSLASSVADSIQVGISAELVTNFPGVKVWHARLVCGMYSSYLLSSALYPTNLTSSCIPVALNIPAIFIALKGIDIIRLFLIADLVCTATVGPLLLGVWRRSHYIAALAGCAAGMLTIFVCGLIMNDGTFIGAINWFALPEGLYSLNSMITFIVTLIVPIVVTVTGSLMLKPQEEPIRAIQNTDQAASPKLPDYNSVQSPVSPVPLNAVNGTAAPAVV